VLPLRIAPHVFTPRFVATLRESTESLFLLLGVAYIYSFGTMDDAVEQKKCADLKAIYSKCFNSWCATPTSSTASRHHVASAPSASAAITSRVLTLQVHGKVFEGRHRSCLPGRVRSVQGEKPRARSSALV
jgi:hypothetical protein